MTLVRLQSNGNYWQAAWAVPGRKRPQVKSLGPKDSLTEREALIRCQELATQHAADPATIAAAAPEKVTLANLRTLHAKDREQASAHAAARLGYRKSALKLTAATIYEYETSIRYLVQHFGGDRIVSSIDDNAIEGFINALEAGRLAAARQRTRTKTAPGPQTIRKHIRQCKAVFAWCKLKHFTRINPFDDFDGMPMASEPNANVSAETIERVIDACPSHDWKALFALCRFAGLRLGEALTLPWTGTATDKKGEKRRIGLDMLHRKIHIVAPKTNMYRVVPMSPRLYEILTETKTAAPDTQATVCGLGQVKIEAGQRIVKSAGISPWPKLFQALRSSCENEWKASGIAEATYTAWLGHGIAVSRAHYVAPTEAEFATITQLKLAS